MKAYLVQDGRERPMDFNKGDTLLERLMENGYHPDSLIVMKENEVVPVDDVLCDGARYSLIEVASGG